MAFCLRMASFYEIPHHSDPLTLKATLRSCEITAVRTCSVALHDYRHHVASMMDKLKTVFNRFYAQKIHL